MPKENPFTKTPKPDAERYFNSVPDWARIAAQKANQLTGGNKVRPGVIDVSPETLQLWYDFAAGGTGKFLDNSATTAINLYKRKQLQPYQIPFVRRLYGNVDDYDIAQRYDKLSKEIALTEKDLKDARVNGDRERLKKIKEKYPAQIKNIALANSIEKRIKKQYEVKSAIENSKEISQKVKQKRLKKVAKNIADLHKLLIKSVTEDKNK